MELIYNPVRLKTYRRRFTISVHPSKYNFCNIQLFFKFRMKNVSLLKFTVNPPQKKHKKKLNYYSKLKALWCLFVEREKKVNALVIHPSEVSLTEVKEFLALTCTLMNIWVTRKLKVVNMLAWSFPKKDEALNVIEIIEWFCMNVELIAKSLQIILLMT